MDCHHTLITVKRGSRLVQRCLHCPYRIFVGQTDEALDDVREPITVRQ